MSTRYDFQHITTELISIFAVLDGLCDSHDLPTKQFVQKFIKENSLRMKASEGAFISDVNAGSSDTRRLLRDQLYEMLCLSDSHEVIEDREKLYEQINDCISNARAFLKAINADGTLVR